MIRIRLQAFALLWTGFLAAATAPTTPAAEKATKKNIFVLPRVGLKTPGVLIPYEKLKAEAEIPYSGAGDWLFFAESLYAPGKSDITKVNPKSNKPEVLVSGLEKPCSGMVSAFGSLWVTSCQSKSLVRVDPKNGKISATLPIGAPAVPSGLAASTDSIWLLTDDRSTLTRVDPETNGAVGEVRVPAHCRNLLFAENSLWVACPDQNQVLRIHSLTSHIEKTIDVSGKPEALVAGENSVWVYCREGGKIDRIDPKTNKVAKTIDTDVPNVDGYLAFGEGSLWLSQPGIPLTKIHAANEKVVQQFYGPEAAGPLVASPGALWKVDRGEAKIVRIDPKRVAATLAE